MFDQIRARVLRLPSENALLFGVALALGVLSSLGVALFRAGIDFFQSVYRDTGVHVLAPLFGAAALIPVLGVAGVIVGGLRARFIGAERHHGIAGIMEASAYAGGRLRYRRMPIKVALASFSIGAGASAGPEDPSVQVGANLGSMLGQWLHLSDDRTRLLVAAGAASGIASAFHAPIAGVFFALEVILGDFSTGAFGVVVLAAVVSTAFTQALNAGGPELGIHAYTLSGPQELPFYVVLGAIGAVVSAFFIRTYYWQQDMWHRLKLPTLVKAGLAGLIVGAIAIFLPQIMGVGSDTLNALLNANATNYTILFLLALTVAKLFATSISLGGGFVGGVFAPSLFVGAALGSAFGQMIHVIMPAFPVADPAAYAMAGMTAIMTGVIRAPITAVLLLFELTDDYRLILPLLLTTAACLIIVERLAPDGIYQIGLARKGVRLRAGREAQLMQTVAVRAVMQTDPIQVNEGSTAAQLSDLMAAHNTHGLLVVNDAGRLTGIVTLQDVNRANENGQLQTVTAGEICTHELVTVTPDMPVSEALALMGKRDLGRVPVVAEDDPGRAVGLLRRRDVVRAYDMALSQRVEEQQRLRRLIEAG
ncbi:MAG: chloride channel protein [Aggregatilineales bacterium]